MIFIRNPESRGWPSNDGLTIKVVCQPCLAVYKSQCTHRALDAYQQPARLTYVICSRNVWISTGPCGRTRHIVWDGSCSICSARHRILGPMLNEPYDDLELVRLEETDAFTQEERP